ncbi:MAG: CoA-binding protein [Candidatus Hodarchaeales archaeon]|jgi:acyl-CoA synthetase (NDP forming)
MAADLKCLFSPNSVAIVGASSREGSMGRAILTNNLLPFFNRVFPINPKAAIYKEILGVRAFASLTECVKRTSEVPDVAVIVIPALSAIDAVEEAAKLGIPFLVIVTAGFKEVGRQDLEDRLNQARGQNTRIVGPNCIGIRDSFSGIDTMFPIIERPPPGTIGLVAQSGAIGVDLLLRFTENNLGLSRFVSYGNAADLNETDFIEYLGNDPKTAAIGCYLEGVSEGRLFMRTALEAAKQKPIVAIKVGGDDVALASLSHTGSLAGDERIYEQVFQQSGILKVQSIEEFVDALKAVCYQSPTKGDEVSIVANTGGPALLAMHQLNARGIRVATIKQETADRVDSILKKARIEMEVIYRENQPLAHLDLTGSATTDVLSEVTRIILCDPSVHGILCIPRSDSPTVSHDSPSRYALLNREFPEKPMVIYNLDDPSINRRFEANRIPVFPSPERAADGLWALVERGKFLRQIV